MNKGAEFLSNALRLIEDIQREELVNIEAAAQSIYQTRKNGGLLYTFGTGHSTMLCVETFNRAGGICSCYPILDERFMMHLRHEGEEKIIERKEGLVKDIFERYPIKNGDTMIIFCYSGRNSTSVDAGLLCKQLGVTSICITSLQHCKAVQSLHSSGLLAHQACDIVIDNHGPTGDASIDIQGVDVGPVSTVLSSAVTEAIICRAVELMTDDGIDPEILCSMNIAGGDEKNIAYYAKYSPIIKLF